MTEEIESIDDYERNAEMESLENERPHLSREMYSQQIGERDFRNEIREATDRGDWSTIPDAVKAWKLIPSRLLELWNTVQKWWRVEQQINPCKFETGFPDASVFWNWEHTGKKLTLPPDGHHCRYELTECWKSLAVYIEAGILTLLNDTSGTFLKIHDRTFRMMTRVELPLMSRAELWPDCLEPCLKAMPPYERRIVDDLVSEANQLLLRVVLKLNTSDEDAGEFTTSLALPIDAIPTNWIHKPGETRPVQFAHGPLTGDKTTLGAGMAGKTDVTAKTLRNRLATAAGSSNPKIWIRSTEAGEFEAFFTSSPGFTAAKNRVDEYQKRKLAEVNGNERKQTEEDGSDIEKTA